MEMAMSADACTKTTWMEMYFCSNFRRMTRHNGVPRKISTKHDIKQKPARSPNPHKLFVKHAYLYQMWSVNGNPISRLRIVLNQKSMKKKKHSFISVVYRDVVHLYIWICIQCSLTFIMSDVFWWSVLLFIICIISMLLLCVGHWQRWTICSQAN